MGTPGRKPKPTAQKRLEGNPGKRPLPEEINFGEVDEKCPSWLDTYGQLYWRSKVPLLVEAGIFQSTDREAMAALCDAYSMWRRARESLKKGLTFKTPNGYEQQKPEVSIVTTAWKTMIKLGEQFGLTPSSRGRLSLLSGGGDDDDDGEGTGKYLD